MTMYPKLPNQKNRTAVVGRTGSGKTVASLWHLSNYPLDKMAWIIFNFKGDELIDSIENAKHIDLDYGVPKKPGVYILHPLPHEAKPEKGRSKVEQYLWDVWEHEGVGVYCDEGYMMGDGDAFEALLTQGRSKRIPMIVCAQRPAWISRFVFSEASYIQMFDLTDARDRQTVEGFLPVPMGDILPDFHSYYYDVGRKHLFKFSPVPDEKTIIAKIDAQLKRNGKVKI